MKKILLLSANPRATSRLRLDEELRDIRDSLERSKQREAYQLEARTALRGKDLLPTLAELKPQIVHFSGHGEGESGLCLEGRDDQVQRVSGEALAGLFALLSGVECVILNACYSEDQAHALQPYADYVIGMSQAIGDEAALRFAEGFYKGLFAGMGYEGAFKAGVNQLRVEGIPEHATPVLLTRRAAVGPAPPPAPFGSSAYLNCDREYQDQDFRQAFWESVRAAPGEPQFYLLHGEEGECHDSFLERLCHSHLKPYAEQIFGKQRAAVFLLEAVAWRYRTAHSAETDLNALLCDAVRDNSGEYLHTASLGETLAHLLRKNAGSVLVLRHNLAAQHWQRHTPELLQRYAAIGHAAHREALRQGGAAHCLVFFNLIYPPRHSLPWWQRDPAKRIAAQLKHAPSCRVLEKLTCVSRDQVRNCLGHLVPHEDQRLTHLDTLFGQRKTARMAEVESLLRDLIKQREHNAL